MSASHEKPSRREIATAIAVFVLGFVLAASLLHTTLRDPLHLYADRRSEKLLMLEQHQGSVFSASFGSSHVLNDFDPRLFDQRLADSSSSLPSIHTYTLNLGVAGGSQTEARSMALEFVRGLTAPPKGTACLVMLELGAGANFQNGHLVHPRSIDVYDWRTVRFVSRLTSERMSLTRRAGRIGFSVLASVLHYTNVGMLSNAIFAPPIDKVLLARQTDDDRRGLEPWAQTPEIAAHIQSVVVSQPKHPALEQADVYPGNADLIDELADASAVRNPSFVYFVLPKLSDLNDAPLYPDHITTQGGRTVPIVNLARPDLFPAIYRPELWYDEAHLDTKGASVITPILVDQLRSWYAQHGAPAGCGG